MENFVLKLVAAFYVVTIFLVEENFIDLKWSHLLLLPLIVVFLVLVIFAAVMISEYNNKIKQEY